MKNYSANKIRNVGVFGHSGEGKTTLVEAMLFNAGVTDRMGRVEDGSTVTDYDPEEIKRMISINAAVAPIEWLDTKINLVDAPGDFDFFAEVIEAMALTDSAIIVTSAVSGPSVGTEKMMLTCKKEQKPHMMVVNQIDKENANFEKVVKTSQELFGPSVVPIQLPIMEGTNFKGYVDIVAMKAYLFDGKGEKEVDIPSDLKASAEEAYEALVEAAAAADDELMEKYFDAGELTADEMKIGLAKGINEGSIVPVCVCSAALNLGVNTLLNNMIHYLPTADMAKVPAAVNAKTNEPVEVKIDTEGKLAARVIKTVADPFVGKISIIRVYSGTLSADLAAYNPTVEKSEKSGAVYVMRGKKLIDTDKITAGDIGAMAKLQFTNTGDSLTDTGVPVKFDALKFPEPCLSIAISAKKQGEEDKVFAGLNRLLEEEPAMAIEKNIETGDVLIRGMGEKHIDVICSKLRNKFKVEAQLADPKVPYRETIRSTAEAEGKHKKQSGGAGQFGVVQIRFEPLADGEFEFVNAIVGGVVPKEFIPAVEKGLREAMQRGVLAGYPMTGLKATLYDGKYHPVDSKEVAFKSAARLSYKAGCAKANPVLIEPIYRYNIHVPNEYTGDIMGDISRRRGRVLGMSPHPEGGQIVEAEAPLAEMFKYATDLRSMTQARGTFTSELVRYEEVPANIAQKIIEQAKREDDEEE